VTKTYNETEDDTVSSNQLGDYSFITAPVKLPTDNHGVVLRCATGLGPASDKNTLSLGGWYFRNAKIQVNMQSCQSKSVFEVRQARPKSFPGIINLYPCGDLTYDEEGVYSCKILNSSRMIETTRVGLYLSGRSESLDVYSHPQLLMTFLFTSQLLL